jgi:hypothetical protein
MDIEHREVEMEWSYKIPDSVIDLHYGSTKDVRNGEHAVPLTLESREGLAGLA